jgi:hypothetical protein
MPAVSRLVNRKRRVERDLSELLGLAKGMLADGVVNDKEADYLVKWGLNHPDGLDQWPTGSRPARGWDPQPGSRAV